VFTPGGDDVSEPLPLDSRPLARKPLSLSVGSHRHNNLLTGALKGLLRVKYNEILKIKCNEKAGFAGLSAIFHLRVKILTIKYNATLRLMNVLPLGDPGCRGLRSTYQRILTALRKGVVRSGYCCDRASDQITKSEHLC
jgi:hypothetical protein